MPDKVKKLVRVRMTKTGKSYQAALRHVRAQAPIVKAGNNMSDALETLVQGRGPTITLSPETIAIVDTNVLLDVYSSHDLIKTYEMTHARVGIKAIDDPTVSYRRIRARESFLLTLYFNKLKATTYSLHSEVLNMMRTRVPPAEGGETMESDFTRTFLWYVKDYLLTDWNATCATKPGNEAKNAADEAYIAQAKESRLPLITNEANGPNGIVDEKMRKLAKDAGVPVFAPREFYAGWIDEGLEITNFLRRFTTESHGYMNARRKKFGEDKTSDVLDWVYGYYRLVLES